MSDAIESQLVHRFFRYLAVTSQSDVASAQLHSTPGQQQLAAMLARELTSLGLDDIVIDGQATVTAVKRANKPGAPRIGFIAHLDTVDIGLSADIHRQRLAFTGDDLCLNLRQDIWFRVAEHPEILPYVGQDILFSAGPERAWRG